MGDEGSSGEDILAVVRHSEGGRDSRALGIDRSQKPSVGSGMCRVAPGRGGPRRVFRVGLDDVKGEARHTVGFAPPLRSGGLRDPPRTQAICKTLIRGFPGPVSRADPLPGDIDPKDGTTRLVRRSEGMGWAGGAVRGWFVVPSGPRYGSGAGPQTVGGGPQRDGLQGQGKRRRVKSKREVRIGCRKRSDKGQPGGNTNR